MQRRIVEDREATQKSREIDKKKMREKGIGSEG